MFSHMGIGKKISLGFALVLVVLVVSAGANLWGIDTMTEKNAKMTIGAELRTELMQREIDHLMWTKSLTALFMDENVSELAVQTDPHKCGFGKWFYGEGRQQAESSIPELRSHLDQIEVYHNKLHASATAIAETYQQADGKFPHFLAEREIDHLMSVDQIDKFLLNNEDRLEMQSDPTKCSLGRFLNSEYGQEMAASSADIKQALAAIVAPHDQLHRSVRHIQEAWTPGDPAARAAVMEIFNSETLPALHGVRENLNRMKQTSTENLAAAQRAEDIYFQESLPNLTGVQGHLGEMRQLIDDYAEVAANEMSTTAGRTRVQSIVLGLIAIVLGLTAAFFIVRTTTAALRRIIDNLRNGSYEVNSASSQVSTTSQSLASGSAEQAASLEETAASLEEMSGATRANAGNMAQAGDLTEEIERSSAAGKQTMERMNTAINDIKKASDDTSKIIKTVDEIAFQTNLLALNAAVEAARAGDAGRGFAVVAEEVRNLAKRSAEAASATAELIEESKQSADIGVDSCREVAEVLDGITSGIGQIAELVRTIHQAGEEQAKGVDQITTAVSQVDQVTQNNAASAEESAAASEELSAQAQELDVMVNALIQLVEGGEAPSGQKQTADLPHQTTPAPAWTAPAPRSTENRDVSVVIPLEEDDFINV